MKWKLDCTLKPCSFSFSSFPKRTNSVRTLCLCCKWRYCSQWFAMLNFVLLFWSFSAIRFTIFYKTLSNINNSWICSFHSIMKTLLLAVAVFTFCTCHSEGQNLEFLNLSSWTRCSSLCLCADDNHSRIYGRCSVDKLDESMDFNLPRQLYSLWVFDYSTRQSRVIAGFNYFLSE